MNDRTKSLPDGRYQQGGNGRINSLPSRSFRQIVPESEGWSATTTPVATGASTGIFSIAFRDAQHGIVVGGDYRKEGDAVDNAAVTNDGGRTWQAVKGLSGFRSVVSYLPGESSPTLIAVGPQGADLSTDDGRTWSPVTGAIGLHTLAIARRGRAGWGAGENGRIMRLAY